MLQKVKNCRHCWKARPIEDFTCKEHGAICKHCIDSGEYHEYVTMSRKQYHRKCFLKMVEERNAEASGSKASMPCQMCGKVIDTDKTHTVTLGLRVFVTCNHCANNQEQHDKFRDRRTKPNATSWFRNEDF